MITNFVLSYSENMIKDGYDLVANFTSSKGILNKYEIFVTKESLAIVNEKSNQILSEFDKVLLDHQDRNEVLYMIHGIIKGNNSYGYEYDVYSDKYTKEAKWAPGGSIGKDSYPSIYFHSTKSYAPIPPPPVDNGLSTMARQLPGINEIVICPCGEHPSSNVSDYTDSLYTIIIHLNDAKKWTREQIADWIETLDIDTTFKNETPNPKRSLKVI